MSVRDVLFGRPISTSEDEIERTGPIAGIGVLGLDALASAAYGPEALLTVLLPLGAAGPLHAPPLIALIVALLALVGLSYWQTIGAYPNGGGAYTVAKENLGREASLFAAAALGLDYVLNVAVAISAGVGALVSAVPSLLPYTLESCLVVLLVLVIVNLRGVRTAGFVFVLPTYAFLGTLLTVIGIGLSKTLLSHGHPIPAVRIPTTSEATIAASPWLLMRAFANGCTAMTGVEAVSNGTPLFRRPSVVGARRTLVAILTSLILLLAGIAALARAYGITATPAGTAAYESVLSRLTKTVVGQGPFYYLTMGSIVAVLLFSANTSFADFPRVCRMLAGDRFLPESFVHRGRRLTFSHGIVVLAALSAALLVFFRGITDALIPLFAVGALFAFTMSQAGMVAHWWKRKGIRAMHSRILNLLGTIATGTTLIVVLASKLREGAWLSVVLVAGMLVVFKKVRSHYDFIDEATDHPISLAVGPPRPPLAVVPMRRWDAVTVKALRFALGLAEEVMAVQVLTGDRNIDDLTSKWRELAVDPLRAEGRAPPKLVVLPSEYRELYAPVVDFVHRLEDEHPDRPIAVVVPELIETRWYHYLLHNHTASVMRAFLRYRGGPQTVIVSIPWYLSDGRPEPTQERLGPRRRTDAWIPWWGARRPSDDT